jgi:hypothetical protein
MRWFVKLLFVFVVVGSAGLTCKLLIDYFFYRMSEVYRVAHFVLWMVVFG